MRTNKKQKLISYGCLLLAVLGFMVPFLRKELVVGADYMYHLARIQTIAENIQVGDFPVKVHNSMNAGYGYGTGFFYPNFFLYLPAFAMVCGVSLWNAYKLLLLCMALGCAFSMYFACITLTKREMPSVVVAVCYLFSGPFLLEIYDRSSLGEGSAFIFVPLVLVGLYNLLQEDFSKPWLLGLGVLGIGLSHPVTTASVLVLLVIACGCHYKRFINFKKADASTKKVCEVQWELCKKLFVTACAVIGLCLSYIVPLLEQIWDQRFQFMEPWTSVDENVLTLWQGLAGSRFGVGIGICIMLVCSYILFLVALGKNSHHTKSEGESCLWKIGGMQIGLATFTILLVACKPFWSFTKDLFNFIQFPWRIHMYAVAWACLGFGCLLSDDTIWKQKEKEQENSAKKGKTAVALGSLMLGIVFVAVFAISAVQFIKPRLSFVAGVELLDICQYPTSNGGGEEWQPVGLSAVDLNYNDRMTVYDEKELPVPCEKIGSKICFAGTQSSLYRLPYVYYKGYLCEYIRPDGSKKRCALGMDKKTHLLRARAVEETDGGYYQVYYAGTLLQKLSYTLCFLTWLGMILVTFFWMWRHRENRN